MIIKLSDQIQKRYPEFGIKAFLIGGVNSISFELTNDKKEIIYLNYEKSLQCAMLMTEFYKITGSNRRCHVETLLEAYIKNRRFKSINCLVDLVCYLELSTGLLMGIHDMKYLNNYIEVYLTDGKESFTHISGKRFYPQKDTICMRDSQKIFASLTEGPDVNTKVTAITQEAIVFIFIPPGLNDIVLDGKLNFIEDVLKNEGVKNIEKIEEIM